jgi:integrase
VILIATREGKSGPESFPATAKTWFKRHVEAKGIISASEIRSYLDRFLLPAWDGREFASIRRSDIAALLDKIEDTHGAVVADAVLTVIRMICNWYETRNEDYTSPIVKGMRRSNPKERARTRKLNDDELREVWRVAEANGVFGSFVRVALLTAQRREKILAMKWDDLDAGEWTIPQAKREKGTAGSLMLPQMALDIINAQPRLLSNDYVFAGQGSGYIQAIGKRKAALDSKMTGVAHYTLHDLRRTARSLMSRAGVRPEIAERVLGHAQDAIEGIYDRHDYSAEKAEALQKLADLIQVIVTDI